MNCQKLGPLLILLLILVVVACTVLPPIPSATPTIAPDRTASSMSLAIGQVEGRLDISRSWASGVRVNLCGALLLDFTFGEPPWCAGEEKSVITDATGYFFISDVTPGRYYIYFDIPKEPEELRYGITCKPGDWSRIWNLSEEMVRMVCFDFEKELRWTIGTVVVESGKTTTYSTRE